MSFRLQIGIAVGCAVLAAVLMGLYAANVRSEASAQREGALARYGGETAQVCVTTRDIAQGETYSERNVTTMEWLVDLLPEGVLEDESQVMGMVASSAVAANTPLCDVDVDTQTTQLEVPAGLSAISVPCSAESAVGGAMAPGSSVDIYRVSDGSARLVCQGASVLATNATGTGANLSWVTLAVDPSLVEALVAASSMQKLYFVLPGEGASAVEDVLLEQPVEDPGSDAAAEVVDVQPDDLEDGAEAGTETFGEEE